MKLISLNIEGSKHLDRVLPFLASTPTDVLCLQEIFERDAVTLSEHLEMGYTFSPMLLAQYKREEGEAWEPFGIALFSNLPLSNVQAQEYWSPQPELQQFDRTDIHTKRKTERHILLSAEIQVDEQAYTIANTHFTWTPNGLSNEYQETDVKSLLALLEKIQEIVLCGDFNMPRNYNTLYKTFIERYRDAIPESYTSSIDLTLHRAGNDPTQASNLARFMVDYIFLSPHYSASTVRLEKGVSDHMAVVADIQKI